MEQLELFPLSEWTTKEHKLPNYVCSVDDCVWKVSPDSMGAILVFNNSFRKWVYKLSHVEE